MGFFVKYGKRDGERTAFVAGANYKDQRLNLTGETAGAALTVGLQGGILSNAIMSSATFESLADKQVLHLTTIGRVTGRPREIEIWFIVYREKFYLFSEHREAAGWVKNIRRNPNASVRFGRCSVKAVARVLDYRKERQLWDEVQVIADRKYGWGDGLPIEITPVEPLRAE